VKDSLWKEEKSFNEAYIYNFTYRSGGVRDQIIFGVWNIRDCEMFTDQGRAV
jgi:hypothetical protein